MNKIKAILIDFTMLIISAIILIVIFHLIYDLFPTLPRLVFFLVILALIPIYWGTAILSIMGKNTIGHRITNKFQKTNQLKSDNE